MLHQEREIKELYFLKHLHDDEYELNFENKLLDKTLSPYLFNNEVMSGFLKRLQRLVHIFFDQHNIVRNFKNPTVDKYEYRHLD